MKKTLLLFAILFSLHSSAQVLCIQCYNQNARVLNLPNDLMTNGGFENGSCIPTTFWANSFCPKSVYYNCDIANWMCTGGGDSTYAHVCDASFSTIAEGAKAAYFGNWYSYSCSADLYDQSCISHSGCEIKGIPPGYPSSDLLHGQTDGVSLEQTVNGLTPGGIYKLEFWAGGELDFTFYNAGIFAVDIGFGNIFFNDPSTGPGGIGTRYVIVFAATSSSHTFKFTNWGHCCGLCTELVLDDIQLFAASEGGDPCTTGKNEHITNDNATVFPNPATNLLTVSTNTNGQSEIILYDIASRKLMQKKFNGSVSLNIEHLARGIFFVELNEGGNVYRKKFVKE